MKNLIEDVAKQIKIDEGFVSTPYECTAGKITIGYGRNIEDNGITREEAEMLLRNDIQSTRGELSFAFDWFILMPDAKQGVLINMCFNLGLTRLLKFKKMLAALEVKDYKEASIQMLDSKWAGQVGERAVRLSEAMARI
tara:strand:+ start:8592 stop:9008 length:417 start_codon:yes stop_codon:yes gene_type:complete